VTNRYSIIQRGTLIVITYHKYGHVSDSYTRRMYFTLWSKQTANKLTFIYYLWSKQYPFFIIVANAGRTLSWRCACHGPRSLSCRRGRYQIRRTPSSSPPTYRPHTRSSLVVILVSSLSILPAKQYCYCLRKNIH